MRDNDWIESTIFYQQSLLPKVETKRFYEKFDGTSAIPGSLSFYWKSHVKLDIILCIRYFWILKTDTNFFVVNSVFQLILGWRRNFSFKTTSRPLHTCSSSRYHIRQYVHWSLGNRTTNVDDEDNVCSKMGSWSVLSFSLFVNNWFRYKISHLLFSFICYETRDI